MRCASILMADPGDAAFLLGLLVRFDRVAAPKILGRMLYKMLRRLLYIETSICTWPVCGRRSGNASRRGPRAVYKEEQCHFRDFPD